MGMIFDRVSARPAHKRDALTHRFDHPWNCASTAPPAPSTLTGAMTPAGWIRLPDKPLPDGFATALMEPTLEAIAG
jgi:hypothetical protein